MVVVVIRNAVHDQCEQTNELTDWLTGLTMQY